MKKYLALLMACLAIASAHASELLDKIAKQVIDSRVVRGEFTQTRELVGVRKPLRSEGHFVVDKQHGVIWQTAKPIVNKLKIERGQIVQRDGDQILMRLSADQEPAVRTVGTVLFALFAGDFATLEHYFNVNGNINGTDWHLQLVPKDAALGKLIGRLSLDGGKTIARVRLDAASGDVTQIMMTNVVNADAPDPGETADFE